MNALQTLLREHKAGACVGVPSVCSSHPLVLEAALQVAGPNGAHALIEATANQVNQFGGYTGMTPAVFRRFMDDLAERAGISPERILLGGDHLGPTCWRGLGAADAMARSAVLVAEYVAAGFRKLHLDCSMSCADDPAVLSTQVIANRAADLCLAAERAWDVAGGAAPVYVIGTEVPTPGGATEALGVLQVTTPAAVDETLDAHRVAFAARGLDSVWPRVVALVVQPGVEFDHYKVVDYMPDRARALSARIEREETLVYEAHSTDYQTPAALRRLVRDHFAVLKVGPALTFALREALWALADIARELALPPEPSLKQSVLNAMRADPRHWRAYYADPNRETLDLQYSLSDRIRYYWNAPSVLRTNDELMSALERIDIPMTLVSQYLPAQYEAVRAGELEKRPRAMILHAIRRVLQHYTAACGV